MVHLGLPPRSTLTRCTALQFAELRLFCLSVKVIARVTKEHADSLCDDEMSGGRRRRADDEVYLNKTLLTDAIRHSLADLQQVTVLRDRQSPVRS